MGGTNQANLNPPASPSSVAAGAPAKASPIRIHQNAGEVHLHDDANNKKFACSITDFYSAWDKGRKSVFTPPVELVGQDANKNPIVAKFEKVVTGGTIDVAITFLPVSFGDTINQIDKFVQSK